MLDENEVTKAILAAARRTYRACGHPWFTSVEDLAQEGWGYYLSHPRCAGYGSGQLTMAIWNHLDRLVKKEQRHDKAGTYEDWIEGDIEA